MERILAQKLAKELLKAQKEGSLQYGLQVIFEPDEAIEKFHPWADYKEHVGVFKIESNLNERYYLAFIEWQEDSNYYVIIFDAKKDRTLAELHKVGDQGANLCWRYKPTKQDGKNNMRKDCFKRYFGDIEVRISIPKDFTEADIFVRNLVTLVKKRVMADELVPL